MFVEQPRIRAGHRLQSEHGRNPGQSCGQPDAVVHRLFLMQGWEGCFVHLNAHAFAMGGRELMCQQRVIKGDITRDIGSLME